ncbi:MAG: hypothetical protein H6966_10335 [Chromatiaceae bacterium]|nr:hypothetical protein [Chromatiaceae bacterium]
MPSGTEEADQALASLAFIEAQGTSVLLGRGVGRPTCIAEVTWPASRAEGTSPLPTSTAARPAQRQGVETTMQRSVNDRACCHR